MPCESKSKSEAMLIRLDGNTIPSYQAIQILS